MHTSLFVRAIAFIAALSLTQLAPAQVTAWIGADGTDPNDATLLTNWDNGVPALGDTITLDTNGAGVYDLQLNNTSILGAVTNLSNQSYSLSSGSNTTWGDVGHVFNATSGDLTLSKVNVQGTLNLGIDITVQGGTTIDAAITPTSNVRIDGRGDGALNFNNIDMSSGSSLVIDTQGDTYIAGDNSTKVRSVPLNLGVLTGDGTDGDMTLQVRSLIPVQGNQMATFGSTASGYSGDITAKRAGDSPASDTTLTLALDATNATGTGELIIDEGAILTVGNAAGANQNGSLRVKNGGFIVIGDFGQPVFSGGSVLETGAGVLIQADQAYTIAGSENVLIDNIQNYTSPFEVNSNTGGIGTAGRGLYGTGTITGQITGTATTINFRGTGPNLLIDDMHVGNGGLATPIITGGRDVSIQRNMQFDSINDYTGGTTITGGNRLRVNHANAAGTGDITLSGSGALLEINADGFTLGSSDIIVNPGTRTHLMTDADANIDFAGGTISAPSGSSYTLSGDLTQGDILLGQTTNTGNLTFTGDLTASADQDWTVADKVTANFDGTIEGGSTTLTKNGTGTLGLNGAVTNLNIDVDAGTLKRGASSTYSGGSVNVASGAVYSVAQDHAYGEVNAAGLDGILAIGADTSANLDFSGAGATARLGAQDGTHTYTGTLTPQGSTYRLGGGNGTLIVNSVLSGANAIQIDQGDVILDAANTNTGQVDINSYAGVTNALAFQNASAVNVSGATQVISSTASKPLAALDLNNTGIGLGSINWNGGGIANSGGSLTAANLAAVFPGGNYVLGGPGAGNTSIDAGALATGTVKKVGSNTITLASGANAFTGALSVFDGKLVVNDAASVAGQGNIILEGGELELNDDATWTATGGPSPTTLKSVIAGRGGKLSVGAGKTLTLVNNHTATQFAFPYDLFVGGFLPADRRGNLILGGEGTIEHAGTDNVIWAAHPDAELILEDSVTFHTNWNTALGKTLLFTVRDGATLKLKGNFKNGSWRSGIGVGRIEPGGTIMADAGTEVGLEVGDAVGYHMIGSGSSISNPHRLGGEGDFRTMTNSVSGTFRSSEDAGNPTAYIEKFGSGTFHKQRSQEGWSLDWAGKFYWIVSGGHLNASYSFGGNTPLGATGFFTDQPNFYRRHIEGILVRDGAQLTWRGTQGFFDDSSWSAALPSQDGDGWLADEFVLEGGATLAGAQLSGANVSRLVLGLTKDSNVFHAYPTVDTTTSDDITLGNSIDFRSGIKVTGPSSLLDVTVTGGAWSQNGNDNISQIRFKGDLTGQNQTLDGGTVSGESVDVFKTLDIQSGSAIIYQDHANVTDTTVASGAELKFNPVAVGNTSISYAGDVTADGKLETVSGTTTIGGTVTVNSPTIIGAGTSLALGSGDDSNAIDHASLTLDGTIDLASALTGVTLTGAAGSELAVEADIIAGRNSGTWDGTQGYISTDAQTDPMLVVGMLTDSGDIKVRTVLNGDFNLDGEVDLNDASALLGSFGAGSGQLFANGDNNYDGAVDLNDASALLGTFGSSLNPPPASSNATIPEPTSIALIGLAGLALIRRRK